MTSKNRALATAVLMALLMQAAPVFAANTTWSSDTDLVVNGITLKILATSQSDSLVVNPTNFQVTVANTETFKVRYPGPNPGSFTITGTGAPAGCNNVSGNNDITVTGTGATLTFTPDSGTPCAGSGGGGSSGGTTPQASLSQPNGGESLAAGAAYQVFWSAGGTGVQNIRLSLSTDGGTAYSVIADNEFNDGFYSWTVPSVATTTAKMRVQALGTGGSVLATDESNAVFTITVPSSGGGGGTSTPPPSTTPPPTTTEPAPTTTTQTYPTGTNDPVQYSEAEKAAPVTDPNASGTYSVSSAAAATPSIDVDKDIEPPPPDIKLPCIGGTLIKTANNPAVYYCGKNGKRYVFPNQKIFSTWFADFSSLKELSLADMAKVPIGGNVTYKPGVRMIKILTDPKVYAIARDGLLRWVSSEIVASMLYGPFWNQNIDDVPDSFFFNYTIGDPLTDQNVVASPVAPAPPAAQCSSSTTFTAFLSLGSSHAEVGPLQELLKCLGYYPSDVAVSGTFGSITETAVKAFQSANGVDAFGYVGPGTREVLNTKY